MNKRPPEVAPGVYMLEIPFPSGIMPPDAMGGRTLCYLVEDEEGWLMVDCGFDDDTCFDALCQQLAALGVSLKDIQRLLVTHGHPDHFGLAGRLKAASNVEVVMHRQDWDMARFVTESTDDWALNQVLDWARSLGVPPSQVEGYRGIFAFGRSVYTTDLKPDIVLEAEDEPLGGGRLRAVLTPGHTSGHVCLYDERRRLLFSGDHVLGKITTHIAPSFLSDDDMLSQYLASLQKVGRLDVDLVLPAHDEPFANLGCRVDELLDHHEQRLDQVLAAVRHHPSSPWEIASQVEWSVGLWERMDDLNRMLAMQETLAHLQLLQEHGRVARTEEQGLDLYRLLDGLH